MTFCGKAHQISCSAFLKWRLFWLHLQHLTQRLHHCPKRYKVDWSQINWVLLIGDCHSSL